jgi:hypothetical protein
MILNAKSVFLTVNVSLCYASGMYLVRVSLLLIGPQGLGHFFRFWPYFPLAGGLYKLYANAGGKLQIKHQSLLVQYKQQANPLLSMHNYTTLVISGNDKNKQLTLLSQCKLAFSERNMLMAL